MGHIISRKKKRSPQQVVGLPAQQSEPAVQNRGPPPPPLQLYGSSGQPQPYAACGIDEPEQKDVGNEYEVPIDSSREPIYNDEEEEGGEIQEEEEEEEKEEEEEVEEQEQEEEQGEEEKNKSEEEEKEDDDDNNDDSDSEKETPYIPPSELSGRILNGDLDIEIPSQVRIVRIFTSSTFTDTFHERNTLMVKIYPKLKEYCQSHGFDFQVVDMRWGVRDEATADHMTTDLCMKELKACQELSTGPNFITFLGQKYGYRPFPPKIIATEFELMLNVITNQSDKDLLTKWFLKDDNAVPPTYVLQSITELIPNYNNQTVSKEERSQASNDWWVAFEKMQIILRQASSKALKDDKLNMWKYYMSVTEDEITRGILKAKDPEKHTHWFKRNINDIHDYVHDKRNTRNFIDKQGSELDKEANDFCEQLCNEKMPKVLKTEQISVYDVRWNGDSGIEPEQSEQHQAYLDVLCKDFYRILTKMIDNGMEERKALDVDDSLIQEICQHSTTCIEKSRIFRGRDDVLEKIAAYLTDEEDDHNKPLIVHGPSGCGKTSIVAKAASLSKAKHRDRIQITRFLGTTSDSSTISKLLYSVVCQIKRASGSSSESVPKTTKQVAAYMDNLFKDLEWSNDGPKYILFLDSIDQLAPDDGAHLMKWLPKEFSKAVKIVISTLPDEKYMVLPTLKGALPASSFLEVPQLPQNTASDILTAWLEDKSRKLQETQMKIILDAFESCPLPLFLKLCFDEARRWKSYTNPKETVLQTNIKDAINTLFGRLERLHGVQLVSHALGMISSSKHGLSDAEIDEILSIDDVVLNDVYQYWTPPVRRIPPLLWVRIRTDLGSYIVSRGANGSLVNMWYHRQFIETATERYLSSKAKLSYHMLLSEYFLGIWSNGKLKPFTNKAGESDATDRLVAGQPNVYMKKDASEGGVFNYRKLSELPCHVIASKNLKDLKDEVLYNFDFLSSKLKAFGYQYLIEDFDEAAAIFPYDKDVKLIHEFFKMSAVVLIRNPDQLPCQIVGRLMDIKTTYVQQLIKDAKSSSLPCLYPTIRCFEAPGGPIIHTLAGHTQMVNHASLSKDKTEVLSVSNDSTLRIWDLTNGHQIRSIDCDETLTMVFPLIDKEHVIVVSYASLISMNLKTQEVFYTKDHSVGYGASSDMTKDEKHFIVSNEEGIVVFDCQQRELKLLYSIEHPKSEDGEIQDILYAGKNSYAYTRGLKTIFFIRDVTDKNLIKEMKPPNNIIFFNFNEDGSKFILLCSPSEDTVAYKKVDLHIYDTTTWEILKTWESKNTHTILYVTSASVIGNEFIWPTMMQINFWNFETGQERVALKQGYQGAQYKQAFCSDENTMVVVSMDQSNASMQVYNMEAIEFEVIGDSHKERTDMEKVRAYVGEGERDMYLHPSQPLGVSLSVVDPIIKLWDTANHQLLKIFKMKDVYSTSIKILDEKHMLIWEHNKKTILTFDYDEGRFLAATPKDSICDYPPSLYMNTWVICEQTNELLTFEPERKYFKTYDRRTGKETGEIKTGWDLKSTNILSNSDGSIILACESDDADYSKSLPMHVFDTVKRKEIGKIQTKERIDVRPEVCFVSQDGKYFICGENYSKITIWNIKTCTLKKEIEYNVDEYSQGTINCMSFNLQNNCLIVNFAVALNENGDYVQTNLLVFYQLESWEILTEIRCGSMINRFEFSADGMRFMTHMPTPGDGSSRSINLYDLSKLTTEKKVVLIGSFVPENDMRFCYLSKDGNALCVGLANIGAVTFFKPCGSPDDVDESRKKDSVEIEVDCPFYPTPAIAQQT